MKIYIDKNDIGKTITYKEENGIKQYLYVHDKEGFIIKLLEQLQNQKAIDCLKDAQFMAHTLNRKAWDEYIDNKIKELEGEK